MKIGLIAGSATKLDYRARARTMYSKSTLFTKALAYCSSVYDKVLVISPKYGVIALDKKIMPYDVDIKKMRHSEYQEFLSKCRDGIREVVEEGADLYFHGGVDLEAIPNEALKKDYNVHFPMKDKGNIGQQLQFYNSQL